MLTNKIKAFFNPEQYHGWGMRRKYFEGWYYKIINAAETEAFAFIPGIAMDDAGKRQAFIQVLNGKNQASHYYAFEADVFVSSPGQFIISILENRFSENSIRISLPDVKGELHFLNNVSWPKRWYSPGIMGPYSFVPFMECYHGIVSMDHSIEGELKINGAVVDFFNGRGYIEKDWGRSFPSGYLWMQSNHFTEPGISIKASVAKIPWLGNSFIGFIAAFWLRDRLIKFTTYNRSVLRKVSIGASTVEVVIENLHYRLEVIARRNAAGSLVSPIQGLMAGRVNESMTSLLEVSVVHLKTQRSIFHDSGRNAGLEVAGNISEILV